MTSQGIMSALRSGVVPHTGLELFATGLEALEAAFTDELDLAATGGGLAKWLRGDYGAGKTFTARYLCSRARARQFATAEVQVSINDTPLYHLETVYRRVVERLETAAHGANAFRPLLDEWLGALGDEVQATKGLDDRDPRFLDALEQRIDDELAGLSARAPAFAQCVRAYYRAKDASDFATAQGLLGWLAGQPHTSASVLRRAGVRGKVDGQAALSFLGAVLHVLKRTRAPGLVLVLDEVETIRQLGRQNREKSLNVLRQLVDALAAGELPGLYLVVTGTTEFFEGFKGVQALPPLAQRVKVTFEQDPALDNLRAPQVRLNPFDHARLLTVGQRVRSLYPAKHPERIAAKVGDAFLEAFVTELAGRFDGHIEVLPRLFLRELVDVLDKVDQHEAYAPHVRELSENDLTEEERAVLSKPKARTRPRPSPPLRPKRLED